MNIFEKLASDINASADHKLADVTGSGTEKLAVSINQVLRKLNNQLAIGSIGSKKLMDAGMPMGQAMSFTNPHRTNVRAEEIFNRLISRARHGGMTDDVLEELTRARNKSNDAFLSAKRDAVNFDGSIESDALGEAYARRFGAKSINPSSRSATPVQLMDIPPASPEMDKNKLLRELLSIVKF